MSEARKESPEALNQAIRDLWTRAGEEGRSLTVDEQRTYRALVTAWAEATRSGQQLAA